MSTNSKLFLRRLETQPCYEKTEVTKSDLARLAKDIKEHIDKRLLPMQAELDEHELILRRKTKMNGQSEGICEIE